VVQGSYGILGIGAGFPNNLLSKMISLREMRLGHLFFHSIASHQTVAGVCVSG
jgi:hypothetical protein